MRARTWAAIVTCASALALACGHVLSEDTPSPAADAGADTAAPTETPLDTFVCGPGDCHVGVQVCCPVSGGGGTCATLADGCVSGAGGDAGPDADAAAATKAPSLAC